MTMQARLVRAMLLALAIAAGAGVLAVFLPGTELFVRVGATCVVTAVAIGFSIRNVASMGAGRQAPTIGSYAGLVGVVIGYICAVLGIWATWLNDNIGWSLLLSAPVPTILGSLLGAMQPLRGRAVAALAAKVGSGMAIAAAMAFLVAAWGPTYSSSDIAIQATLTGVILTVWAIAAACCLLGVGVDRHHWRLIGFAAAAVAGMLLITSTWTEKAVQPSLVLQCIIIAVFCSHANLIIRAVLPAAWVGLSRTALGSAALAAACASYLNLSTPFETMDQLGWSGIMQVLSACVIVSGCSSLAIVVLQRVRARNDGTPVVPIPSTFTSVRLDCPRCSTTQDAPVGTSGCINCGLLLQIGISIPQCKACGYNTLDLKSATCPECGAVLNAPGSLLA
jgi:hypothetical protein